MADKQPGSERFASSGLTYQSGPSATNGSCGVADARIAGVMPNRYDEAVESIGKMLVVVGLALALIGAVVWLGLGKGRGGLLPGDLSVERGDFKFYFPLVSCLVVSGILTLGLWLLRR